VNGNFFDLLPSFMSGVQTLRSELIGVAFVFSFAGLTVHTVHALIGRNVEIVFPALVRLTIVSLLIIFLESWSDTLVIGVEGLKADLGATGGFSIFEDYQAAIARKMGSATAAANFGQAQRTPSGQPGAVPSPLPDPTVKTSGVTLTHYAYPGDDGGTPGGKIDSNSAQGIGAFPFSSAPGSLIPGYSAALTASAAAAYNIQPGQSFSVTTSGGQTYNLLYADVAPESDQRVDIYDPNGQLAGGNDFSQSITSINGGPIVEGQTGPGSFLPNLGGSIQDQILWAFTLALSWIASAIMWLMTIAQKLLYLVEIAISPVFIGFLMIPALTYLARRFFLGLVAIILWPLAWGICNLVSKALIDIAVNPSNNAGLGIAGAAALVSGPLAGLAYLIVVAVWVIGSTLLAPVFVSILLATAGGTATAAIFGGTLGAALSQSVRTTSAVAGGPAGAVSFVAGIGSNIGSRMNGAPQNFARRPINSSEPKES
jgi:hypothetical protein